MHNISMGNTSGGTVRTRYDAVIVGCGPVGQTLAGLLGARGHTVGVFERHDDIYPLPRAVRLDGEAMRIFQEVGVAAAIADELHETTTYTWFGADGANSAFRADEVPPPAAAPPFQGGVTRVAALVRPDHYVFGSAAELGDVGPLVDDLVSALHLS